MTVRVRPWKRKSGRTRPDEWEVDIWGIFPDGTSYRERTKSRVPSKSGSKQWGVERERELLAAWSDPKSRTRREIPTLREFFPRFIEGHCKANKHKPSGIHSKQYLFRIYLEPLLGDRQLDAITNEDVAHLKGRLVKKANSTTNNCLSLLSKILTIAKEWDVIADVPCRIKLLKVQHRVPRFYDFEEYDRLVAAAREADPRIYAMVLLGGDAGLRRGEMVALDRAAVNFVQSHVAVEKGEWRRLVDTTKGRESRVVPMTNRLRAALLAIRHLRGDLILYTDESKPLSAKIQQKWMARVQRKAGLKASGEIHILRHTFCSHLAMRGAPALAIQKLAGHKSLQTTMRYMHLSPGEAQRAIRLLEPSGPGRRDELPGGVHQANDIS